MKVTYELITENNLKNDHKIVTDRDIARVMQLAEVSMNELLNKLLKSVIDDGSTITVKCKSITDYLV